MRASAGQIAAIHNPILLADWTILKAALLSLYRLIVINR
jgi:hypothetical protein